MDFDRLTGWHVLVAIGVFLGMGVMVWVGVKSAAAQMTPQHVTRHR